MNRIEDFLYINLGFTQQVHAGENIKIKIAYSRKYTPTNLKTLGLKNDFLYLIH